MGAGEPSPLRNIEGLGGLEGDAEFLEENDLRRGLGAPSWILSNRGTQPGQWVHVTEAIHGLERETIKESLVFHRASTEYGNCGGQWSEE